MASVIFWAVLGGLAGAFGKLVLWDDKAETWAGSMLLSLAGGLAGGYAGTILGGNDNSGVPAGFGLGSMVLAVAGAAVALTAYHGWMEHRRAVHPGRSMRSTAA